MDFFAVQIKGEWREINGAFEDAAGCSHAANVPELWTAEELAQIGVVQGVDDRRAPAFTQVIVGPPVLEDVDGVPTRRNVFRILPLDEVKAVRAAQVAEIWSAKVLAGFPCTLNGEAEALQLRDDRDRTNWLVLKDACADAIAAGQGDAPCELPLRTAANRNHQLTYAQTAQLLRDMRAWAAQLQGVCWAKKDAIAAAADYPALAAIDINAGWPGS